MIQNSRKPRNPRNRSRQSSNFSGSGKVYESNGPDIKIRGSAEHIVEKYITLARELGSSGDRVTAESYSQFAEHYQRLVFINQENERISNIEKNDKGNNVETNTTEQMKSNRDKDTAVKDRKANGAKDRSNNNIKKNDLKDNERNLDTKNVISDLNLEAINSAKELELGKTNSLNDQKS